MKQILTSLCLMVAVLLFSAGEGFALPPCPEDRNQPWHNCFGTVSDADGNKYVGEWRDSNLNGQGTLTWSSGKKYVGEWRDGKPNGQGTATSADGRVQEGVWENGKFQYARKEPKGLAISQGLLDELLVDEENTSSQIYELIKPILLYDPEVVKITVLKDLKVFKGIYDGFEKPIKNDDRQIYKWLNAKSGDILLKVNVQVNLDQNYVSEIKSKLAELADVSEPMDGSSCKRCKLPDPNAVKFYIGAIKGNGRTQVYL